MTATQIEGIYIDLLLKLPNLLTNFPQSAFREVFGLFDINGGGTIDAQELHSALCSVDILLSHEEIEDVLCVMDEDGIFSMHLFVWCTTAVL